MGQALTVQEVVSTMFSGAKSSKWWGRHSVTVIQGSMQQQCQQGTPWSGSLPAAEGARQCMQNVQLLGDKETAQL